MARIIWDRSGNPNRYVSDCLGIERSQLKEALHRIKASHGLGPTDRVTIWDNGAAETPWETSMMKSEAPDGVKTFATLRVVGDRPVSEEITRILKIIPARAYAKGQRYSGGARTGELVGKTGVWYFATDRVVASNHLVDHLMFLINLLDGSSPEAVPLTKLRRLGQRRSLRVVVSCFWYGRFGAKPPTIPRAVIEFFTLLPAEIELDYDTDEQGEARRSA